MGAVTEPSHGYDFRAVKLCKGHDASKPNEKCAMAATAYLMGLPHTDVPKCVDPVIVGFVQCTNDLLNANDRNALLAPRLLDWVGTNQGMWAARKRTRFLSKPIVDLAIMACPKCAGYETSFELYLDLAPRGVHCEYPDPSFNVPLCPCFACGVLRETFRDFFLDRVSTKEQFKLIGRLAAALCYVEQTVVTKKMNFPKPQNQTLAWKSVGSLCMPDFSAFEYEARDVAVIDDAGARHHNASLARRREYGVKLLDELIAMGSDAPREVVPKRSVDELVAATA